MLLLLCGSVGYSLHAMTGPKHVVFPSPSGPVDLVQQGLTLPKVPMGTAMPRGGILPGFSFSRYLRAGARTTLVPDEKITSGISDAYILNNLSDIESLKHVAKSKPAVNLSKDRPGTTVPCRVLACSFW